MPKITEDNFLILAMHAYDNPQCVSVDEFEKDLAKFTYLKKLLYRYVEDKETNERLVLNHLVILYNLFGDETTRMLFFKMEQELWPILITYLVYLKRMPDYITEFNIHIQNYPLQDGLLEKLRLL